MAKRLEDQLYYHGIRTKEDIETELKDPGDFLVRAAQFHRRLDLVLNVMSNDGLLCNILLKSLNGSGGTIKYCLHSQVSAPDRLEFDSIPDLINFYKVFSLPGGVKLKRGIKRPGWLIKHNAIVFNQETDKLGSGNFCDVYKGKYTDDLGRVFAIAIKVCHTDIQNRCDGRADEVRSSMLQEAKLMSCYSHPNIIEFFGIACDHPPIWLVMEFCPGGSLEDHLVNHPGIESNELILYCFEVARGMRYLSSQKCVHRDLATRNCLISSSGVIKISDFGLSKIINDLQSGEVKMMRIPIRWTPPECLSKHPAYSELSDVWSYGVLIYEVFNKGVGPWADDKDFKAMARRIRAYNMPALPERTPPAMSNLVVEKIWQEPEKRASFKEIFVILADYLFDRLDLFPLPKDLFINKINGVHRKTIIDGTKQEVLSDETTSTAASHFKKKKKQHKRSMAKKKATSTKSISSLTASDALKQSTSTTSTNKSIDQHTRASRRRHQHHTRSIGKTLDKSIGKSVAPTQRSTNDDD